MKLTLNDTSSSLFTISAPSGAGKTSLVSALLKKDPSVKLSISHTTRQPRPGETHGKEYFFTDTQDFKNRIQNNEFLEYAQVFDHFYGTSKLTVLENLKKGNDVILEIDWQGAHQIKALWPNTVSIFILPPSFEELQSRLIKRNQDSAETIQKRLAGAALEIKQARYADFIIINKDFEVALQQLCAIIKASRCRFDNQAIKLKQLFTQFDISC